ncbi:MAG: histidine kinase [Cyclobacteriaceae bacterium]|nr:histidine kinase [Cyclobacteriaceae bacterium]
MFKLPPVTALFRENFKTMIGMVIAGFVMSWFVWRACCERVSAYFWISFFTVCIWLVLWLGNAFVSQWLDNLYSWHKDPVKRLIAGIIGMIVYTIGAVFAVIWFFNFAFGFNVGNRLEGTFFSTIIITLIITMFMTGRAFLLNWKQTAVDAERLKKESVEAQYNSLRNQVNPHFLFNSLNALTNLVYQNQDQAVRFIKQLSDVYRYVLDTRDKEVVPVQDEIKFLNSFLFLQQIRFGDKLRLDIKLNDVTGYVAPLALQMLVENAIKHNVISEENPLTVKVYASDQYLAVENSLLQKTALPEESPGLGLDNIRKRYEFLTDKQVLIEETKEVFKVSLPIVKS